MHHYVIGESRSKNQHFLTKAAWENDSGLARHGLGRVVYDPLHARQFDTFQEALAAYAQYAYGLGRYDGKTDNESIRTFGYRIFLVEIPKVTYKLMEVS